MIDVWINGERGTKYATQLGTTTPTPTVRGHWRLPPPVFPSSHSVLYIYAHDRATGVESVATVEINIVDR